MNSEDGFSSTPNALSISSKKIYLFFQKWVLSWDVCRNVVNAQKVSNILFRSSSWTTFHTKRFVIVSLKVWPHRVFSLSETFWLNSPWNSLMKTFETEKLSLFFYFPIWLLSTLFFYFSHSFSRIFFFKQLLTTNKFSKGLERVFHLWPILLPLRFNTVSSFFFDGTSHLIYTGQHFWNSGLTE